jgi:tetratricopeptide (TPR) repeat protein
VLAYVLLNALDFAGAGAEFARARSLPGSDAVILALYGSFLAAVGDQGRALALTRQAQSRDPLNADIYAAQAFALDASGRIADAVAARREALHLGPDRALDRAALGYDLILLGRDSEAKAELAKMPADFFGRLTGEAILLARHGDLAGSDSKVGRIDQLYGDTANYQYGQIFAQRGEKDRAFRALGRAWALRDPGMLMMKTDNFLRPLRSDTRFAALEKKLNYPPIES